VSVVQVDPECCCGSIGRTDLRQCPEHHHIYRGDVRLTSVGRIVRQFFPISPDIPPEKLENARLRGESVDQLFSAYVIGKLDRIPAGTRVDVCNLLTKLITWFNRQNFKKVESQVLIGDDEVGGVADLIFDDMIVDLKATYDVSDSHKLQVAGYVDVTGHKDVGAVLHVTERFAEPRLFGVFDDEVEDFRMLRNAYRVLQRRSPKGGQWAEIALKAKQE
jgi:hypothetical protein